MPGWLVIRLADSACLQWVRSCIDQPRCLMFSGTQVPRPLGRVCSRKSALAGVSQAGVPENIALEPLTGKWYPGKVVQKIGWVLVEGLAEGPRKVIQKISWFLGRGGLADRSSGGKLFFGSWRRGSGFFRGA